MSNKRISLSRILAVNWYGFRQIFDVTDDILISGVFGSGKSVLLDLMQYVMLGEHWRPNRAAAGNAMGRNLRSYCLCDTNTTREGEPHYTRRSAVTLVALEFTWPRQKNEAVARRETWGIRIEYAGPTSDPKQTYFCLPERMEWEHFSSAGQLMDDEDFRSFIRREHGHEFLFSRQKDYLEEMATPQHLYFDREQLNKTMWKAIAFEPEQNIELFIRDFILEDSPVEVRDVKAAVGAYRETLVRLERQEGESVLLREVCRHHDRFVLLQRSCALSRHLGLEIEHRRLAEALTGKERELEHLDSRHAAENEDFQKRLAEIETLTRQQEDFKPDAGEQELQQKQGDKKRKYQELTNLREAQQSIRRRLEDLEQCWRRWLRHGLEMKTAGLAELLPQDDFLNVLSQGEDANRVQAIPLLAQRFNNLFHAVEKLMLPLQDQLRADTNRLKQLAESLEKLERGETPGAFPLFKAVRERSAAEQLCRLIEVTPEAENDGWRPALEMFLGRNRFSIVTASETHYRQALEILRRASASDKGSDESLVHPREALELRSSVEPGSLASKVGIIAPDAAMQEIAQSFAHYLLGQVIAVESPEALDHVERGISREGILKQKPIRRKLRVPPGTEYTLGREGLSRLKQALLKEQGELRRLRDAQQQQMDAINFWVDSGKKAGLSELALPDRSNELYRVPILYKEIEELNVAIDFLATPEREARVNELQRINDLLKAANQAIGGLRHSIDGYTVERSKLESTLKGLKAQAEQAAQTLTYERKGLPVDITDEEIEAELARLSGEAGPWKEQAGIVETRQAEFQLKAVEAKNDRLRARDKLGNATDAKGRPSYPEYRLDFDAGDESNERWSIRLELLEQAELPKYRQQAVERRKDWERRLRDQVLNRLNENLSAAERTVRELRQYLDRTVGRSRYRITQRRDPSFSVLWSLLDSGFEPTDELLASSRNAEIQTALDELMAAVEAEEKADERARRLLDYRYYHRYDIEMVTVRDGHVDSAPISLGRSGRNLSGGENQAPFFISTLAAFRRVYDRGDERSCHLGLVVMDEAFSKLSGDGVEDCLDLARNFNLQLVMAFPIDRLGVMAPFAQTIVLCKKEQQTNEQGYVSKIDNIPILLTPEQVEQSVT